MSASTITLDKSAHSITIETSNNETVTVQLDPALPVSVAIGSSISGGNGNDLVSFLNKEGQADLLHMFTLSSASSNSSPKLIPNSTVWELTAPSTSTLNWTFNPIDPLYFSSLLTGESIDITYHLIVDDALVPTTQAISVHVEGKTQILSARVESGALTGFISNEAGWGLVLPVLTVVVPANTDVKLFDGQNDVTNKFDSISDITGGNSSESGIQKITYTPSLSRFSDYSGKNITVQVVSSLNGTQSVDTETLKLDMLTMLGTPDMDHLLGTTGADAISALGGDDWLDGGLGDDTLDGGEGNDTFADEQGNNLLIGGAGDDTFYLNSNVNTLNNAFTASDSIIGGMGIDRYILNNQNASTFIITDFESGEGGDIIDIGGMLDGSKSEFNPFDQLYGDFRLIQGNANSSVYLQKKQVNANLAVAWQTVLILQNTGKNLTVGDLTIDNFAPHIQPNGSAVLSINQTGALNTHFIDGSIRNDTLTGTGLDYLKGFSGNDSIVGSDNDTLDGGAGNDTLIGGAGDNYFFDYSGSNSIIGGAGNDHFYISTNSAVDTTTITGGEGVDTFHVIPFAYSIINGVQVPQLGRIVVTDFTAGTGGDVIEVGDLLKASLGYTADTTGYLRLLQDNSTSQFKDIQLQWDKDGSGSVYGWQTLLTLQNVNQLGDANFDLPLTKIMVTTTNTYPPTIKAPYFNQGIASDQPWVYPLDFASHFSGTGLSYNVAFSNNGDLPFYVDMTTGQLSAYPSEKNLGKTYPVLVRATDTAGASVDLNFSVSVLGFNAGNIFTAASSTQSIVGTAGIDTVSYADFPNTIQASLVTMTAIENLVGSQSADSLTGDSHDNIIDGGAGSDTLNGGEGIDTLIGGLGNDVYIIDHSADVIKERPNAGIDEVRATVNFTLPDNVENLVLLSPSGLYGMGNNQNNSITGSSGSDTLDGGGGADTMRGGAGDDIYYVDNPQDVVIESSGEGTDTIYSTVSYRVPSNVEKLVLSGRLLINATADSSPVTLIGNIANNKLTGSSFADTLIGGLGADTLTGGEGSDLFLYYSPREGKDKITDFVSGSDKIGLLESAFPSGWNNHQLEATSWYKMTTALTSNPVNLNSASTTGGGIIVADSAAGVAIYYTTHLNAVTITNSTLLVTLTGLKTAQVTANDFVSF